MAGRTIRREVVRILGLAALLLLFALLVGQTAVLKPHPSRFVIEEGEPLALGWTLRALYPQPDHVRLVAASVGQPDVALDVFLNVGRAAPWTTRRFAIMEAMGSSPPEDLIRGLLDILREREAGSDFTFQPPRDRGFLEVVVFVPLYFLALLIFTVVLVFWVRAEPALKRPALAGGAAVLGFGILILGLLPPEMIPPSWITVMQHGLEGKNIRSLYGLGAHAGLGLRELAAWLTPSSTPTLLEGIVRFNIFLGIVNGLIFFLISRGVITSRWVSCALTLWFALNLNTLNSTVSELPSPFLLHLFGLGVLLVGAMRTEAPLSPWKRWLAFAGVMLLVFLAGQVRPDAHLIGLPALLVLFWQQTGPPRLAPATVKEPRAPTVWPWVLKTLVVLAVLDHVARLPRDVRSLASTSGSLAGHLNDLGASFPGYARWLLDAIDPFQPGMSLVLALFVTFFSPGVLALAILGFLHTALRPVRFLLLPIGVLLLARTYASSSAYHYFTAFRYLTLVAPFVLIFAMFGVKELETLWREHGGTRRRIWGALLVLFMLPLPFGAGAIGAWREPVNLYALESPLLAGDQQVEVRYLIHTIRKHPTAIFAAPVSHHPCATGPVAAYDLYVFAGRGAPLRILPLLDGDPLRSLGDFDAGNGPLLLYHGLDCHLTTGRPCLADGDRWERNDGFSFTNTPYTCPLVFGTFHPHIRLELFQMRR